VVQGAELIVQGPSVSKVYGAAYAGYLPSSATARITLL